MSWIFDTVLEHEHITEYSYYGKRIQIQTEWKRWWHKLHDISPLTSVNTTITICSILFFSISNQHYQFRTVYKHAVQVLASTQAFHRDKFSQGNAISSCFPRHTSNKMLQLFRLENWHYSNFFNQKHLLVEYLQAITNAVVDNQLWPVDLNNLIFHCVFWSDSLRSWVHNYTDLGCSINN